MKCDTLIAVPTSSASSDVFWPKKKLQMNGRSGRSVVLLYSMYIYIWDVPPYFWKMNPHISVPRQHSGPSSYGGNRGSSLRMPRFFKRYVGAGQASFYLIRSNSLLIEGPRVNMSVFEWIRLFKFPQMDFEMAIWEMTRLLWEPKRVFKSMYYHVSVFSLWRARAKWEKRLLFLTSFTVFFRKVWSGAPSGIERFTRWWLMMPVIIGISVGYSNVAKFAV